MEWTIFHRYRNLVMQDKAKELLCPDCGLALYTRIHGEDDEPHLWCITHGFSKPGLRLYQQMQNVVSEHYLE